jgi:Ca2+-binding EF-hand superfamily protein
MMLSIKTSFSMHAALVFVVGATLSLPVYSGGKYALIADGKTSELKPLADESEESGLEQTIEYNFSPEDRARLRKALSDYAKNTDPEHNQIEQRRKLMRENVEARFNECDKDNDESIDRVEATECLPQIARHFSYVDVDEDNVITLEELELAQAKMEERKRAEEAKMEAQRIQEVEAEIKSKGKVKDSKQALNTRKHPS